MIRIGQHSCYTPQEAYPAAEQWLQRLHDASRALGVCVESWRICCKCIYLCIRQEVACWCCSFSHSVYTVTLSMMEIYCEMLNDLLDSSKLNLDVQVGLMYWTLGNSAYAAALVLLNVSCICL